MSEYLWPLVALIGVLLSGYIGVEVMNRLLPKNPPEPSATDLFKAIEEHKAQVDARLDNLTSKLEMRTQSRPGIRS